MHALPQPSDYRFLHRLRVRWAEVDLQGVVFNGHYLLYLEAAMAARWRAMGVAYAMLPDSCDGEMYVKKTELTYHSPARLDDLIDIGIRVEAVGRTSLTIASAMFVQDRLLLTVRLVYVWASLTRPARPLPVPDALRALLEAYEAGEPMLRTEVGSWSELGADARAIRDAVFIQEQGITPELEWDDFDAVSRHLLVRNRLGRAVACARLLPDGHLGRVAVLQPLRGSGIGAMLVQAAIDAARRQGNPAVEISAQRAVSRFYRDHGFVPFGDSYLEAGLPHQAMRLELDPT